MLKKSKAFTITELVIVIAVIAILAAVMIPTFSGVIESAKVSTDTANAGILSTELKVALMNSEETITEANAHRLLKEEFAAGKSGGIVPQSAGYGYHFVYNFNNGMIEVKHISEITKSATQSANMSNGGADVSDWGNVPETCFLQEGYFLLDTAGSALSEVVNGIYTVASTDDLTAIANAMGEKLTKDYAAAAEYINAYLDTVVFIGSGLDFTTAADRNSVKNIVFVEGVNEITSVVNTVSEGGINQSVVDYDNPVATLNDGAVVEIPASVNKISHNALVFAVTGEDKAQHNEQRITLHFEGGIDQVAQGLDIGFTNCEFTFGDSVTVYHLSDDGTQILDETNEVVETLESQYPVTDFDIRIDGVDTSNNILSVALDQIGTNHVYQFVAYNFKSGENNFASDTTVTWSIDEAYIEGENYTTTATATIDSETGSLTINSSGAIVVTATSVNGVKKQYLIEVNAVVGANVNLVSRFNGQVTTEEVIFDGSSAMLTLKKQEGQTLSFEVFVQLLFPSTNNCQTEFSVTRIVGEERVDITGIEFVPNDVEVIEIAFDSPYDEVRYTITITCIDKIFNYNFESVNQDGTKNYDNYLRLGTIDEKGNPSSVNISFMPNVDRNLFSVEATVLDNNNLSVSADNDKLSFSAASGNGAFGGKVEVKALVGDNIEIDSFIVEVIYGAVNVSTKSQFVSNKTMCLVNDIGKDDGGITVGAGCTLYGNGYTIEATSPYAYTSKTGGFVTLNGTLDNVKIIGLPIDNYYFSSSISDSDKASYYKSASTIQISTSGTEIRNSYIANGNFTIRYRDMYGNASIVNSTLINGMVAIGVIATKDIFNLNLTDVTLAQFERNVNGTDVIGAGFAFNEGGAEKVTVNFYGQDNQLLNFVTYADKDKLPTGYDSVINAIWGSLNNYKFEQTSEQNSGYLHIGMLALLEGEGEGYQPKVNFSEN